jgi:peptidoglycan/xylan/chitin deacetylase (PgdA/CDA1 family)
MMQPVPASMLDLKRLGKYVLAFPLAYLILRKRALRNNPTTILCYHTLRPDNEPIDAWTAVRRSDFLRQMEFLRAHYDIVSLDHALDATGSASERPRAVVTFDDGEAGLHDILLPLLNEMRLPVTLYIATGQIETGRAYWFDDVMNALQADGPFTVDLTASGLKAWSFGHERGAARWATISEILEALKSVSPAERPQLAAPVVAQAPTATSRPFKPLQPLTIAQLQDLAACEWVTIAAHSHCHNLLDQIPEVDVKESVSRSRDLLETWTGRSVRHLAYPNGNHNKTVEDAVSGLGFISATALTDRLWRRGMDAFSLPRISVGRYDDFDRFKLRLAEI